MFVRLVVLFIVILSSMLSSVFAQQTQPSGKIIILKSIKVEQNLNWFAGGEISITTSILSNNEYPYLTMHVDEYANIKKGSIIDIETFEIFIPDFLSNDAGYVKVRFDVQNLGHGVATFNIDKNGQTPLSLHVRDDDQDLLLTIVADVHPVCVDIESLCENGSERFGNLVEVAHIDHPDAYKYNPVVFTTKGTGHHGQATSQLQWVSLGNYAYFTEAYGVYSFFSNLPELSIKTEGYNLEFASFYSDSSPGLVKSFSDIFTFDLSKVPSQEPLVIESKLPLSQRKSTVKVWPIYYRR